MSSTPNLAMHPFWIFSSHLLNHMHFKKSLRFLENEAGFNPHLTLFCLWYGKSGYGRFSQKTLRHLSHIIIRWHERIVLTIHGLKSYVGTCSGNASQQIWLKELDSQQVFAEQIEQRMLTDTILSFKNLMKSPEQRLKDAHYNLKAYSKILPISIDSLIQQAMVNLISATFPSITSEVVYTLCRLPMQENPVILSDRQQLLF